MIVAQNPTLWAIAGLLFNMAGAGLLFLAFSSAAHAPSTAASGVHDAQKVEQWMDARAGAGLLLLGFFFQATGVAGTHALDPAAAIVLLGLALSLAVYAMIKHNIIDMLMAPTSVSDTATETRPQLITSERQHARQIEDLRHALAVGS